MQRRKVSLVFVLAVFLILAGSFIASQNLTPEVLLAKEETPIVSLEPTKSDVVAGSRATLYSSLTGDPYRIADIAEQASPAIVYIQVEWPAPEPSQRGPQQFDPWDPFRDFWFFQPFPGQRQPNQQIRPRSQGTGFIIDESGIIVTNQHVVGNLNDGQTITVTVHGPEVNGDFEAKLLGADSKLDLAVLQIEADRPLPTVTLGDSDKSRPGEWVIAIGNPYGKQFEHTVTVGVLSAKGREITIRNPETGGTQVYQNLMQTDAAINRGNSGGPLLNIEGEVIGINTAVHAQAQGIGFAIPINIAKDVLEELIETGGVEHKLPPRAWLGVWYNSITQELAEHLNLPDTKGIVIADVMDRSPALEAGLRPFDIIRRVDDTDITRDRDFAEYIASKQPGDRILLTVLRQGQSQFITVTLGDMPAEVRR